jgi:hypothetical protein
LALICWTASLAPLMVAVPAAAYAPVVPARPPKMIRPLAAEPDPPLPPLAEDAQPAARVTATAAASRPAPVRSRDERGPDARPFIG